MKWIEAVLCILTFTLPSFGQTTAYATDLDGTNPPTNNSKLPSLPPLVITSDYYAQPKTLIVHALNNSGKDIVGYTLTIRNKLPDGTLDKGGWSETSSDMLGVLVTIQLAKDPAVEERERKSDHGIFFAGTTRDMPMNGINSGSDLDIVAAVVFYADGSFDEQNEDAFKRMVAARQGTLMAMKKVNEAINHALADPTTEDPSAAAVTELSKYLAEEMNRKQDGAFDQPRHMHLQIEIQGEIQNLQYMQRPQQGMTERECLSRYVEEQEKRIELMTPHCHLEIALKQ